jgi:hypothetical protein
MLLANGVMVDATSQGAGMDTLRDALASMDVAGIGSLARDK